MFTPSRFPPPVESHSQIECFISFLLAPFHPYSPPMGNEGPSSSLLLSLLTTRFCVLRRL